MSASNLAIKLKSSQSVFIEESGYKPLPSVGDRMGKYSFCGYHQTILPMDEEIAVGFGYAFLTKNNEHIYLYEEMTAPDYDNCMTVAQAEEIAAADSKHDWRIHLISPLSERHYQRQGKQQWILYKTGAGFA